MKKTPKPLEIIIAIFWLVFFSLAAIALVTLILIYRKEYWLFLVAAFFAVGAVTALKQLRLALALRKRGGEPTENEKWSLKFYGRLTSLVISAAAALSFTDGYFTSEPKNNLVYLIIMIIYIIAAFTNALSLWSQARNKPESGGDSE